MTQWNDLLAAALVGAGRTSSKPVSGPATPDAPLDATLAQLPSEQSPEQRLLSEAGVIALWRHAGAGPHTTDAPLPPASAPDEAPPCPESASAALARLIRGDFPSAVCYEHLLPEWLDLLDAHGYALPHRWLPELLNLARELPDLYLRILPRLDARGRWLAAQHPEWRGLLTEAEPVAWETADTRSRLALLRSLRRTDPARAREMLDITWKQERANEREAFLETFEVGLGPDDEPLLEASLDDRGRGVRAKAAALLACLPDSALVQRMKQRLAPLFKLQREAKGASLPKNAYFKVTLPKECDAAMTRDGMNDSPPQGTGKRIWRMIQMLGVVPPAFWSETWQLTPAELVRLADTSGDPPGEHAGMILAGWAWATVRYRDAAWAEALLQRWMENPNSTFSGRLAELVKLIPPEKMDAWLIERLKQFREQIEGVKDVKEDFGLLDMLQSFERPWSEALSRAVFVTCHDLTTKKMNYYSLPWKWAAAMPDFAHYITTSLHTESASEWPDSTYWRGNIETFLSVLHFRWQMAQGF
ncbi:MAG: hypothetical protein JXA21_06495 [Anaerolineae bacterium]|nr:hypothetical protein [Anaerolineae bacterium]